MSGTPSKSRSGVYWKCPLPNDRGGFRRCIHIWNNTCASQWPWKARINQRSPFCGFSFICYKFILRNRCPASPPTIRPYETAVAKNKVTLQDPYDTVDRSTYRRVYAFVPCSFQHWQEDRGYRRYCAIVYDACVEDCNRICRTDWKVGDRLPKWSHCRASPSGRQAQNLTLTNNCSSLSNCVYTHSGYLNLFI